MCRKNPVHFREYSHDFAAADSESEDEADMSSKPMCPHGARCYRKNPAHHREYTHPAKGKHKHEADLKCQWQPHSLGAMSAS